MIWEWIQTSNLRWRTTSKIQSAVGVGQIAAWLLLGIRHRQKSLELVGGLEHLLCFHILGFIIPTNFHIFQTGRYTTNQGRFEVDFDVSIAAQGV